MNLLTGKIKPLYLKYLGAAFGSACISSVYGLVDMAMVGQYHGPSGTAAMSVVMPIFNIIYSLGLFMGIGGSVLYSSEKGRRENGCCNEFFSTALLGTAALAAIAWTGIVFFGEPLLRLFGAEQTLLPLTKAYLFPIKIVIPVFVFNQMLAAFLRNDNAPGLATAAGACITLLIMLTHFFSKRCTLKFVSIHYLFIKVKGILTTGFSTFFVDLAVGIMTMLFNRQIVRYLGTDALSVYGLIVNISMFVQCCAYSVGQASQPIFSINYGAEHWGRMKETLKYALGTVAFFGIFWTTLVVLVPNGFVRIFMKPTEEVLQIAPSIMRCYGISFLLLPLNIFSTYYFQSLMKPAASFVVSVGRGLVISGALIMLLPTVAKADFIWFSMPVTEIVIAVFVIYMMVRYTKRLAK